MQAGRSHTKRANELHGPAIGKCGTAAEPLQAYVAEAANRRVRDTIILIGMTEGRPYPAIVSLRTRG